MTFWRDHSRTIVGLATGSTLVISARLIWSEGGPDFDIVTTVGAILLALGIEGIINANFCEIAKPEEPIE